MTEYLSTWLFYVRILVFLCRHIYCSTFAFFLLHSFPLQKLWKLRVSKNVLPCNRRHLVLYKRVAVVIFWKLLCRRASDCVTVRSYYIGSSCIFNTNILLSVIVMVLLRVFGIDNREIGLLFVNIFLESVIVMLVLRILGIDCNSIRLVITIT